MRHALLILLLPMAMLLSGCCEWWSVVDSSQESSYDEVRVENQTDQTVIIRWATGSSTKDFRESIDAGSHKDIHLRRGSDIKADYNHLIHYYDVESGAGSCPCERTVIIQADDFVPATPFANG